MELAYQAALDTADHVKRVEVAAPSQPGLPANGAACTDGSAQAGRQPSRTVSPIRKELRRRNKAHLAFVGARPCLVCQRAPCNAHHVIAEFTERECEGGEDRPAYAEAEKAVLNEKAFLLVASNAGSSGTPFRRPNAKGNHGVFHVDLNAQFVPTRQTIALPVGSSADLSLYADYRPSQLDTLIYFCNSGATALSNVVVAIDSINMKEFYEATGDAYWAHSFRSESVGFEQI